MVLLEPRTVDRQQGLLFLISTAEPQDVGPRT